MHVAFGVGNGDPGRAKAPGRGSFDGIARMESESSLWSGEMGVPHPSRRERVDTGIPGVPAGQRLLPSTFSPPEEHSTFDCLSHLLLVAAIECDENRRRMIALRSHNHATPPNSVKSAVEDNPVTTHLAGLDIFVSGDKTIQVVECGNVFRMDGDDVLDDIQRHCNNRVRTAEQQLHVARHEETMAR